MPELNTVAPKKWPGNYGGLAPTLTESADDIRVGDIAVDISLSPQVPWVCKNADDPVWVRVGSGRDYSDVYYVTASNTPLTPLTAIGVYYLDSDAGNLDIYIEDSTAQNEGKIFEFRKPNLTTSYNTVTLRTPSGQAIGPSATMVLQKPGDSVSLIANNFVSGGAPGRKWRQITSDFSNPNIIEVSSKGAQFTSIEDAVTFANTYVTSKTGISIGPGTYTISSTITITNPFITTINGQRAGSTVIKPDAGLVGSPIFDCQVPIGISNITIDGTDVATYKTTSGGTAIKLQGYDGDSSVEGCKFIKCNLGVSIHGLQLGGTSQTVHVDGCIFERCTNSIDVDSGTAIVLNNNDISVDVEDEYAIYVHNSTTQGITKATIQNLTINSLDFGIYAGKGVKVEDNCIFYMNGFEFYGFQEGVHINNGTSTLCAINNGVITSLQNYGIKVEGGSNFGVNSILIDGCDIALDVGALGTGNNLIYGFGLFIDNSTTYDIAQRNSTDSFKIYNSSLDRVKMLISDVSNMELTFFDQQTGDSGFKVYGELAVGSPELGKDTLLGGGNSYTRGMLVYTYDAGTDTYTDISEEARSATGSTFTFTGTDDGDAIYVASDLIGIDSGDYLNHLGIQHRIDTAAVWGSGSIVVEYWSGDESSSSSIDYSSSSSSGGGTSNWKIVSVMETNSDSPYYSYGNSLFTHTGFYQLRYDNTLTDSTWDKNDPPSTGTNRRWIRFRIVNGITTAPIFEQFKLHTNRTKVNADGFIEFFGKARPVDTLPWDLSMIRPSESSPGNQNIYISKNISIGREFNLMGDNDKIGFMRTLPQSLDTSTPIKFKFAYRSENNDIVNWKIYWAYSSSEDIIYIDSASAPAIADTEKSLSFSVSSTGELETWASVELDVSDLTSFPSSGFPDNLWVNLEKVSGDGVIALVDIDAQYTRWSNGGKSI